jgi:serine/threonine-protein kinase
MFAVEHDELTGCRLGPYQLDVLLGTGGLGSVYEAQDVERERTCAIRVLSSAVMSDAVVRRRVLATASRLSRLDHPQLAVITEIGSDLGFDFVVSEFVAGLTLEDVLYEGPVATAEIIRIGRRLALALDAAHAYGILHGNLHPGNVKLTPGGEVKILDLGFSTLPGASRPDLRHVVYLAPERVMGEPIDARSDVFGLGATLYELATGRPPFRRERPDRLLDAVMYRDPLSPTALNPLLPKALETLILKAMRKLPDERHQSAAELARHFVSVERTLANPELPSPRPWWSFLAAPAR